MKRCRIICCIIAGLALAACSSPPATPEPDRVATRVAEEQAIAATLTAVARAAATPTPFVPPTPVPPTPMPPTAAPPSPSPAAATSTPRPLATTPARQIDPVVPGVGDPRGLEGQIILPGYPGPVSDVPVFRGRIVFRLNVYDPAVGAIDGSGIRSVDFTITDPEGEVVHTQTENQAGFCAFGGGEPTCTVWVFAEHGNTWSKGKGVLLGTYSANMTVHTTRQKTEGALWKFEFEIK